MTKPEARKLELRTTRNRLCRILSRFDNLPCHKYNQVIRLRKRISARLSAYTIPRATTHNQD